MLARVTGPAREHDPPVGSGPPVSSVDVRRIVALFVLPYVLLGLWWALANPAIAAPDEDAHLVKALGMARFDIGVPGPPAADPNNLGEVRNASITRVVEIPGPLDPAGYTCFIFHAEATAACQPTTPRTTEGDVAASTTLGAYPPFLYPVAGWVASLGSDPASADRLGRLVVLAASVLLLWLACAHVVRINKDLAEPCQTRECGPHEALGRGAVELHLHGIAEQLPFERLWLPLCDDAAAIHDREAIRKTIGFFEVVGRQKHGDRVLAGEARDFLPEVGACFRIQARRGLVHEEDAGPVNQAHRDVQFTLHPAGLGARDPA